MQFVINFRLQDLEPSLNTTGFDCVNTWLLKLALIVDKAMVVQINRHAVEPCSYIVSHSHDLNLRRRTGKPRPAAPHTEPAYGRDLHS
jgi:hypothetical protein